MKLNLFLVFLLALILSGNVIAVPEDALTLDSKTLDSELEDANSMTWPMLPGESLSDVARLFYPKSKAMRQRFIAKTLRLNKETQPDLNSKQRFDEPTLLVIPTLKSLSNNTRAIKSGPEKVKPQQLRMSFEFEQMSAKLVQEYELLLSKNAFLKEELAKLNQKLIFLQAQLNELKLVLDKTLTLPAGNLPSDNPPDNELPSKAMPADGAAAQKVFKNLNQPATLNAHLPENQANGSLLDFANNHLIMVIVALCVLTTMLVYLFSKYQRRMVEKISFAKTKMQETVTDFGGYFQTQKGPPTNTPVTVQAHIVRAAEARVDATLEEAKLLMSINRSNDAIAHLKMTLESQPKASINHWLYLLEIFRKLNLKDEFESYAANLHNTFNVLTPVWHNTEVAMVVPQSLEEFPHIVEKLCSTWPQDEAATYLRNLLIDNRGGERSGFGKEVVEEILLLIALQDLYKSLS